VRRQPARPETALAAAGGALAAAMVAVLAALALDWLRGPTLLGRGNVPLEELVLCGLAAGWGWRIAASRRRLWFLPAEPGPDRGDGGSARTRREGPAAVPDRSDRG
jgi:hypothetical protein